MAGLGAGRGQRGGDRWGGVSPPRLGELVEMTEIGQLEGTRTESMQPAGIHGAPERGLRPARAECLNE